MHKRASIASVPRAYYTSSKSFWEWTFPTPGTNFSAFAPVSSTAATTHLIGLISLFSDPQVALLLLRDAHYARMNFLPRTMTPQATQDVCEAIMVASQNVSRQDPWHQLLFLPACLNPCCLKVLALACTTLDFCPAHAACLLSH